MALCALLVRPARAVQTSVEGPIQQSIFVDDRAAVVYRPRDAATVKLAWAQQSQALGLIENDRKLRIVSWTQAAALHALGMETNPEAVVLGTNFFSCAAAEVDAVNSDHRERVIKRLGRLPIGQAKKEELYRTREANKLDSAARRATGVVQVGARSLWQLFAGQWAETSFFVQFEAVTTWLRAEHYWRAAGTILPQGAWTAVVRDTMRRWGFAEQEPWQWVHPVMGRLQWFARPRRTEVQETGHLLREAWRREKVERFLRMPRRDSEQLAAENAQYNEDQVQRTRLLYRTASAEQRAVLLGAGISEAAYTAMRLRLPARAATPLEQCRFCGDTCVPSWHHVLWRCGHFEPHRPRAPDDPWSRRLA